MCLDVLRSEDTIHLRQYGDQKALASVISRQMHLEPNQLLQLEHAPLAVRLVINDLRKQVKNSINNVRLADSRDALDQQSDCLSGIPRYVVKWLVEPLLRGVDPPLNLGEPRVAPLQAM